MTVCLNVFRGFVPNFANLINSRIQAWTAAAFICILDAFFGVSCIAGDGFYGWLFETVITELSRLWKVCEALSHFSKLVQRYRGFIQAVLLKSVFEKRLSFWMLYLVKKGHKFNLTMEMGIWRSCKLCGGGPLQSPSERSGGKALGPCRSRG